MIRYDVQDGVCVLTLDAPPLNMMDFALLAELEAAVRRAADDRDVAGIVLYGGDEHFSAGADIQLFQQIETRDDAVRISQTFQAAFQTVEDAEKPVVAACAGRMMGGAVELAAACHGRVCTDRTRFNMPEVNLGINPGAGGTQRLPRWIGVGPALRMMLTAAPIDATEAKALGLVDAVCEPTQLAETAVRLAAEFPRSSHDTERSVDTDAFRWAEGFVARSHLELIALRKIVEAVRAGVERSPSEGMLCERQAFADCTQTPGTRNKIRLFFATRAVSKGISSGASASQSAPATPSENAPTTRDVETSAVIGMGSMGAGIAHALAMAGLPVVAVDENESALARGRRRIADSVARRVEQGKLESARADATLALITTTTDVARAAEADLVIEAVVEIPEVKRQVFAAIEAVCREETVIGTNTSTLSLDLLADGMRRPERLIGMHFFNPAHRMPLVELILREGVADDVVAAAASVVRRLRKTALPVKNREGFLVNRIFIPYLKEAFWLLEEGASPEAIDAAMVQFGMPMGPLALIDMAGIDVLAFTDRVLRQAFPRHGPLSEIVEGLVALGRLGQKTGSGVYKYEKGGHTPVSDPGIETLAGKARRQSGRMPRRISADEIVDRLVLRMVAEATHVMREGLVRDEDAVDVGMVLGIGFPDFHGGVLGYARGRGIEQTRDRLRQLQAECGPRYG